MQTPRSVFEAMEAGFARIAEGPRALTLPASILDGGPHDRAVPLGEVRRSLLLASTPYEVRDRAVSAVVERASDSRWQTGLVGLLLPGLRASLGPLVRAFPRWRADLESEALVGLLAAAPAAGGRPRVASRLIWAARTQAAKVLTAEVEFARREITVAEPAGETSFVPCHPDLALARAERAGIVGRDEARLIGETRIGDVSLHGYADEVGGGYGSVRLRRYRAEQRLVRWAMSQ